MPYELSGIAWSGWASSPLQIFFDVQGVAGPAQNGSVAGSNYGKVHDWRDNRLRALWQGSFTGNACVAEVFSISNSC
jgi:hypothetical protein